LDSLFFPAFAGRAHARIPHTKAAKSARGLRGEGIRGLRARLFKYRSIAFSCKYCYRGEVKTTIDVPDEVLHRAKVVAAQRRTTLRELVLTGLDQVLVGKGEAVNVVGALARLERGMRLGGKFIAREEIHARR